MSILTRHAVIALLIAQGLLCGCSFVSKQVGVTASNRCIHRDCKDEQGAAHPSCAGECRRRYEK